MHKTQNDLPEKTRTKVSDLLNARLADAIDLRGQAKHAHWNVKGPNFIALHKLFDDVADQLEEYIDEMAERITALGGLADGLVGSVAKRTQAPAYPAAIVSGREHVEAMSKSLAAFGKSVREAIDAADEWQDKDTADLFTEVSRGVDKYLWFVEAHLQSDR